MDFKKEKQFMYGAISIFIITNFWMIAFSEWLIVPMFLSPYFCITMADQDKYYMINRFLRKTLNVLLMMYLLLNDWFTYIEVLRYVILSLNFYLFVCSIYFLFVLKCIRKEYLQVKNKLYTSLSDEVIKIEKDNLQQFVYNKLVDINDVSEITYYVINIDRYVDFTYKGFIINYTKTMDWDDETGFLQDCQGRINEQLQWITIIDFSINKLDKRKMCIEVVDKYQYFSQYST